MSFKAAPDLTNPRTGVIPTIVVPKLIASKYIENSFEINIGTKGCMAQIIAIWNTLVQEKTPKLDYRKAFIS